MVLIGLALAAPLAKAADTVPVDSLVGVHPRLLLDAKRVGSLRASLATTHAFLWERYLQDLPHMVAVAKREEPLEDERYAGDLVPELAFAWLMTGRDDLLAVAKEHMLRLASDEAWGSKEDLIYLVPGPPHRGAIPRLRLAPRRPHPRRAFPGGGAPGEGGRGAAPQDHAGARLVAEPIRPEPLPVQHRGPRVRGDGALARGPAGAGVARDRRTLLREDVLDPAQGRLVSRGVRLRRIRRASTSFSTPCWSATSWGGTTRTNRGSSTSPSTCSTASSRDAAPTNGP